MTVPFGTKSCVLACGEFEIRAGVNANHPKIGGEIEALGNAG
jgi:hypothetical protein